MEVITMDWLQIHVRQVPDAYPLQLGKFIIVRQDFHTKQFSDVYYIFIEKDMVATLVGRPHSGILQKDSGLLKIENKYLYQEGIKGLVEDLLKALDLKFINVSRIDIACDFNEFQKGLNPERFIYYFMNGQYVKLLKSKFFVSGMHTRNNSFEYIRFGASSSMLCYYIYNKSKEMNEVKQKPWITELWKEKGLDTSRDVWRLEFRIHSNPRGLVDEETGETYAFSKLEILDTYNEVYRALFHKYMDFRYEDGQEKKCRMKKIPLLALQKPSANIMRLTDKMASNRSDKIFMRMMIELREELRGTDTKLNVTVQKLLNYYAYSRDLQEHIKRKFPGEFERMNVEPERFQHETATETILNF